MEDNWLIIILSGSAGTIITLIFVAVRASIGNKPIAKLLKEYQSNPVFSELRFSIVEGRKIIGKVNGVNIELIPLLKYEVGIEFHLTLDLSEKPYYATETNLGNALGNQKFKRVGTNVIIEHWEPKIFNYGKFEKVISEIQKLIDDVEQRRRNNRLDGS